jgi:predicted dehydrogenase
MSFTRRHFLQTSAAAAVAAPVISLQAAQSSRSSSPGEKVGLAIIGVRSRGNEHINSFVNLPDAEILYVCDCDEKYGRQRQEEIFKKTGKKPTFVKDFRKALEDPAVDAISTATPNHWHALVAIWSMQAGKDVYVEKPVSHNVSEGRLIVNAARALNRICQCGTQSRSSPSLHEAVKWVHEGHLGAIQYALGTCYKARWNIGKSDKPLQTPAHLDYDLWCGPAAKVDLYRPQINSQGDYNPHYDWHWDHNTGNGDMGNQGIHQMDIARWFLGESTLSPRTFSIGGRLGYVDSGNTPNTQIVYHAYPKAPLLFETRGLPRDAQLLQKQPHYENGDMDEYRGSRVGVIVQCEQGYVVIPSYTAATAYDPSGKKVKSWSGGGDHFANFLDGIKSRNYNDLNCDILDGHLSSGLCHTGMVSHQVGHPATRKEIEEAVSGDALLADSFARMAAHLKANGVDLNGPTLTLGEWLTMDPQTEQLTGNSQANRLLTREYRRGYEVPSIQA